MVSYCVTSRRQTRDTDLRQRGLHLQADVRPSGEDQSRYISKVRASSNILKCIIDQQTVAQRRKPRVLDPKKRKAPSRGIETGLCGHFTLACSDR